MADQITTFRRNLFEIENARNLTHWEVVKTFVPTQSFWRLLSAKHHVLLGSRGSGKTAVAKMLSHDHLSLYDEERARSAVAAKAFIGIYVPTKLEWIGGLRNKPWQTPQEKEEFFCWRLNVATCLAFLNTVRSCLNAYITDIGQRARAERELCEELSQAWVEDGTVRYTLDEVQKYLQYVEQCKQVQLAAMRANGKLAPYETVVGVPFSIELFAPLRWGMAVGARVFEFPEDTAWLLCLDEAEFLEEEHMCILNSHMRAHSGNLFFKITTQPLFHDPTLTVTRVPLDPGHDFEYVYLDRDRVLLARTSTEQGPIGTWFARTLFSARAQVSGGDFTELTVQGLLGASELLDATAEEWQPDSKNMRLLEKYASTDTVNRARKLLGKRRFRSQVGAKIHGALLLRDKVATLTGREQLDAYSGATMVLRCGDSNPRRLIRIFNAMLLAAKRRAVRKRGRTMRGLGQLREKQQTQILTRLSEHALQAVESETGYGAKLLDLLTAIGSFMQHCLHDQPLTTDQVTSVSLGRSISKKEWQLVRRAVGLGLLYPNVNPNTPDELPVRKGTYHLAYILAPYFRLLPRRGKARSLAAMRRFQDDGTFVEKDAVESTEAEQVDAEDTQLRLFSDGDGRD